MTGVIVLLLRILGAVSLYIFLGWTLLTIWRELRMASSNLTKKNFPPINIEMLDNDEIGGIEFHKNEILIGRDDGCDYKIPDETVSSRHARLSFHHNQWWIEDLQSTNGTFLNDDRVFTSTVIISGDELRCGKVNLKISIKFETL